MRQIDHDLYKEENEAGWSWPLQGGKWSRLIMTTSGIKMKQSDYDVYRKENEQIDHDLYRDENEQSDYDLNREENEVDWSWLLQREKMKQLPLTSQTLFEFTSISLLTSIINSRQRHELVHVGYFHSLLTLRFSRRIIGVHITPKLFII